MRILFMMDQRFDRGSIQSISNYVRAGDAAGHHIALYGPGDSRFPTVRFPLDLGIVRNLSRSRMLRSSAVARWLFRFPQRHFVLARVPYTQA